MKLVKKIVSCTYDSSITATGTNGVNNNQEDTGYLAVYVDVGDTTNAQTIAATDNVTTAPVPKVKLATAGEAIYGAVATINTASGRCGVITEGIVPFKAEGSRDGNDMLVALDSNDIGKGVMGAANGRVTRAGKTGSSPSVTYTDGTGRGLTVGRGTNLLWVDLSTNNNTVS